MIDFLLVADIGGTNARLALCSTHTGELSHIQSFPTASYPNLEAVMRLYRQSITATITHACLAIACPVMSDTVALTNHHWQFSIKQLQADLQLTSLEVINDFAALSMSIPMLTAQDVIQIGGKSAISGAPIAIYGAGTGLGVSHLLPVNGQWICCPGEGGHVDFAPNNYDEDQILQILRDDFGHVSAERVLSGQGLVNIYHGIVKSEGRRPLLLSPSDISERALSYSCPDCVKALTLFCTALGRFGGNLALNMGTLGGVYIAGGIVPRFLDFFVSSSFRNAFEDKGRFRAYLEDIPAFLIRHDNPGLLGAGAYFRQKLGITL